MTTWNPRQMDIFDYFRLFEKDGATASAATSLTLSGEFPLSELTRLCDGFPEQTSLVSWRLTPKKGVLGEKLLLLSVKTTMTLMCQRCIQPMDEILESQAVLNVVASEDQIDHEVDMEHLDELVAEPYDNVLGSTAFNVLDQIEDELILSLPYLPKHQSCDPKFLHKNEAPSAKKESPFKQLAALKNKN